jgi:hypothetical protein
MLKKIAAAERDQQADCARVNNAVRMAEAEIAFLETRHLDIDEFQKRRAAIRDRTILAIRDVRQNMAKRAVAAKSAEQSLTDEFIRHDAGFLREYVTPHLNAFVAMLERTPGFGPLGRIRNAIGSGDGDLHGILLALEAHEDSRLCIATIKGILAEAELAGRAEIRKRLAAIMQSSEQTDARITALLTGAGYSTATTPARGSPGHGLDQRSA